MVNACTALVGSFSIGISFCSYVALYQSSEVATDKSGKYCNSLWFSILFSALALLFVGIYWIAQYLELMEFMQEDNFYKYLSRYSRICLFLFVICVPFSFHLLVVPPNKATAVPSAGLIFIIFLTTSLSACYLFCFFYRLKTALFFFLFLRES